MLKFEALSSNLKLYLLNSEGKGSEKGLTLETSALPFLPYGGITYLINSFDYPNLLCFNSPPTQHQFL